jgi:hypothetical protein
VFSMHEDDDDDESSLKNYLSIDDLHEFDSETEEEIDSNLGESESKMPPSEGGLEAVDSSDNGRDAIRRARNDLFSDEGEDREDEKGMIKIQYVSSLR